MLSLILISACGVPALLEPPPAEFVELGQDIGAGNIVGIQAWVDPTAYYSAERLEERLAIWFDDADARGWLTPKTVVVLPEAVGTWLVVLDEPARVLEAPTAGKAFERLVKQHPTAWLQHRSDAPAEDAERYAVFSMKAEAMAAAYQQVMTNLATDYQVTLVAGTILLPEPELVGDELWVQPGGELYDVSLVFSPDGGIVTDPIAELYPDSGEADVVSQGSLTRVDPIDLPHVQLGVLPGEDAWFPETWDALTFAGDLPWVVAPQYFSPDQIWRETWLGYDGWEEPADVDPADVGTLDLYQADLRYGLPGRLEDQDLPGGMAVPLRGHLWDLGSDGVVRLGAGGTWEKGPLVDAPVVANLWLDDSGDSHR